MSPAVSAFVTLSYDSRMSIFAEVSRRHLQEAWLHIYQHDLLKGHARKLSMAGKCATLFKHLLSTYSVGIQRLKKKSGSLPFRNLKPPEEKRYK